MWGREMRAALVFVLASLAAGGAFREWRRAHETRFRDLVASLESAEEADPAHGGERGVPAAREGDPGAGTPGVARAGAPIPAEARGPGGPRPGRIDPERATEAEWERLPGIGPALARRIVADREAHGPFGDASGLLRVPGIGPRTLERIRPWLVPRGLPAGPSEPPSPSGAPPAAPDSLAAN